MFPVFLHGSKTIKWGYISNFLEVNVSYHVTMLEDVLWLIAQLAGRPSWRQHDRDWEINEECLPVASKGEAGNHKVHPECQSSPGWHWFSGCRRSKDSGSRHTKHCLVAAALGPEKPSGWGYAGSMVQSLGKTKYWSENEQPRGTSTR